MRRIFIALAALLTVSCQDKQDIEIPTQAELEFTDLKNAIVDYNTPVIVDLNKDGTNDFHFISVFVYNNPNDKLEFIAHSENENLIYNDNLTPKVFDRNETIPANNSMAFTWNRYNPLLITRVFTIDPANNYWEGAWKDKTEKYLGVKVKSNGLFYSGWVKISYSANTSRIVIHSAAISKKPGVDIIAGQQ